MEIVCREGHGIHLKCWIASRHVYQTLSMSTKTNNIGIIGTDNKVMGPVALYLREGLGSE